MQELRPFLWKRVVPQFEKLYDEIYTQEVTSLGHRNRTR